MGKGKQTVTNITEFPDFIREQMEDTFALARDTTPAVYDGSRVAEPSGATKRAQTQMFDYGMNSGSGLDGATSTVDNLMNTQFDGGTADINDLRSMLGQSADTSALQNALGQNVNMAELFNLVGQGVDTTGLANAGNATTDLSRLDAIASSADTSALNNLLNRQSSIDALTSQQGRQNAATDLLSGIASSPSSNPYLEGQIANAIQGATDKATSQYSLGGRLGSNAFAGSLGAGITNAAGSILSQNLQNEQAAQLQAAQALGNLSGQDMSRDMGLAQSVADLGRSDLDRTATVASNLAQTSGQDLNRLGDIAGMGINATQADLARALAGQQAITDSQQRDFVNQINLGSQITDTRTNDLNRQTDIANALTGASQADLNRDVNAASTIGSITGQDAARSLQAQQAQAQMQLQAAQQAAALASQGRQTDLQNMGLIAGVGADQTALRQAQIDADRGLLADQNASQQQVLNNMLAASGLAPNFAQNTTTTSGGQNQGLTNALGGALSGFGIQSALGASAPAWLTPTMAGGAGALLGLISDIRLKTNLRYLGKEQNGLKVYDWEWNDKAKSIGADAYPRRGYIAQEVQRKYPKAIMHGDDGYLRVDISAIPSVEV